jgi:hypothetical protein
MPITVTCSGCGRKSAVPDSAAGSKAQCKACRKILTIPGAAKAKVCVTCGTDVSQRKRTKDAEGNYYCEPCWAAKVDAARAGTPAPGSTDDDAVMYPCGECEGLFAADEVYDEGGGATICRNCWQARATRAPAIAAKAGGAPADPDLPPGLEFSAAELEGTSASPPPLPAAQQPSSDLFCEGCHRVFPPEKLKLQPDGAVLCKQCLVERKRGAKSASRTGPAAKPAANWRGGSSRGSHNPAIVWGGGGGGIAAIILILRLGLRGCFMYEHSNSHDSDNRRETYPTRVEPTTSDPTRLHLRAE